MGIRQNIEDFMAIDQTAAPRRPNDRSRSFDYCYNYFRGFFENREAEKLSNPENMATSCMHLASYLASWGMYRGKSPLLPRSLHQYKELVEYISKASEDIWKVDVNNYTDSHAIDLILQCENQVRACLSGGRVPTITLTTKVMLGVFGNVPAFDTYFMAGLGVRDINRKSLDLISDFYLSSCDEIDSLSIHTLDFDTQLVLERSYPRIKIVDMHFFQEGYRELNSPSH